MPAPVHPLLTRLHPSPSAPITVRAAYDVARTTPAGRPWVGVCMIASLDGSVAIGGTSGGLGNANDLEVLLTLRDLADVIVVGAGTVRDEGYTPPKRSGRRVGVVTRAGRLDPDSELFRSGAGFAIAAESTPVPDGIECLRSGGDRVDLAAAIARLDEVVPRVRAVQVEGGPTLNAALLDADLIDEIDLTMAPMLVGGDGARAVAGATEWRRDFDLAHLLADDEGYVFGRWLRRRA